MAQNTPAASLSTLTDVWGPHVSFSFNLLPPSTFSSPWAAHLCTPHATSAAGMLPRRESPLPPRPSPSPAWPCAGMLSPAPLARAHRRRAPRRARIPCSARMPLSPPPLPSDCAAQCPGPPARSLAALARAIPRASRPDPPHAASPGRRRTHPLVRRGAWVSRLASAAARLPLLQLLAAAPFTAQPSKPASSRRRTIQKPKHQAGIAGDRSKQSIPTPASDPRPVHGGSGGGVAPWTSLLLRALNQCSLRRGLLMERERKGRGDERKKKDRGILVYKI